MSYPPEIKHELIVAHWEMVESLFTEFMLHRRGELAHKGAYLYYLMLDASHDPRFNAVGLGRHPKELLMAYTSPLGLEYMVENGAAAFLGLGMVGEKVVCTSDGEWTTACSRISTAGAQVLLHDWPNSEEFKWWLRWRTQQLRGYTDKARDLHTGYEINRVRDFPDTLKLINELYPQKDSAL